MKFQVIICGFSTLRVMKVAPKIQKRKTIYFSHKWTIGGFRIVEISETCESKN